MGVGTDMMTGANFRNFRVDCMMRYSLFVPRLYNLCHALGFEAKNLMPSRAFCADENQGFPIILMAKHFGAFPFNHGRAGGTVATDRHGPHAHHGKDLVIVQASHVGYDTDSETFGQYCRLQTPDKSKTPTCGKVNGLLKWYMDEYAFAMKNIRLGHEADKLTVTIDNQILDEGRREGLFVDLERMVLKDKGKRCLIRTQSTARVFLASYELRESLPPDLWTGKHNTPIGKYLHPEMFFYRRPIQSDADGYNYLEKNLIQSMPWIVTAPSPMLVAAQINTQEEFDRTYRTIIQEPEYSGRKLLFISCLNIDISPEEGQMFPLTKCIPWAAYIQNQSDAPRVLEQDEIYNLLMEQDTENPNQITLEKAIQQMIDAPEVKVAF